MISIKEYIVTTYYWFYNLFYLIINRNIISKPTMPYIIEIIIQEIKNIIQNEEDNKEYMFIDMGCGLGNMLQPMCDAKNGDKQLFNKVIGVELDSNMCNKAKLFHKDPKINIICKDMFVFIEETYGKNNKISDNTVIYFYDPLWKSGLSEFEKNMLYGRLLDYLMNYPGTIIIYCSCDNYRDIPKNLFRERNINLKNTYKVCQNGIFNFLKNKYNPLEIWQIPFK